MILNLDKALKKKKDRNWPKMYWAIDIHGTLFRSTYSAKKSFQFYNGWEKKFLQWLSNREDCVIIIYTSSHKKDIEEYIFFLRENNIWPTYINSNNDCPSTELADFSKKFYFDVLIDDKAGFQPYKDWKVLYNKISYLEKMLG